MTIRYSDGRPVEAALLSRTENTMRVAVQGADDATEFTNIKGTWVAADCEPVSIEFAWQRLDRKPTVSEAECCCSRELAAKLIHSLFAGGNETAMEAEAPAEPLQTRAHHLMV